MLIMDTENNVEIPAILAPDARSSLNTAKTFLKQAVEALLSSSKYGAAKTVIDILGSVDNILHDKAVQTGPVSVSDTRFTQDEVNMIVSGRKIEAIKMVRQRTGYGLKEAKDLVESYKA